MRKKIHKSLYLKTIISALFFSLSILFVDSCGFLIIPAFILLYMVLAENNKIKQSILTGFLWGIVAFGLHFIWLYEMLIYRSDATFLLATGFYSFMVLNATLLVVVYFFISSGLFVLFKNILLRITTFFITTFSFFYYIDKYCLFFLEKDFGYPFANPLIPLAKYKFFLFIYSLIFSVAPISKKNLEMFMKENKIIYLKPMVKSFKNNYNALTVGQMVYHQLANLNLHKYSSTLNVSSEKYKNIILLSPETYFPYSLNNNKKIVKLWKNVLPNNSYFFVGSQREEKNIKGKRRFFQTVYLLKAGRIINFYDKTHCTPFGEKIPSNCKKQKWARSLFLTNKIKFTPGCFIKKKVTISNNFTIIPRICSEFFYRTNNSIKKEGDAIFLFVNDSWLSPYFRRTLKCLAKLISLETFDGIPIFYIGHEGLEII